MSVNVLVVDDEPAVVDRFSAELDSRYTVETACSGETALELATPETEVALIDRKMPGMSGADLLDRLQARQFQCQIAMVTAVDPGFDILDMPFDDYLTKPVTGEELRGTVCRLSKRSELDAALQDYAALVSKRGVLEREYDDDRLARHEEFHRLTAEIDERENEIDSLLDDLEDDEIFDVLGRPQS